jgi:hypothetical protein
MKIHCRQISPEFQSIPVEMGTEWIIHNGPTEPDLPHEIQGPSMVCYGKEDFEIRFEIAQVTKSHPGDVLLWEYAGGFSKKFLNRNRGKK